MVKNIVMVDFFVHNNIDKYTWLSWLSGQGQKFPSAISFHLGTRSDLKDSQELKGNSCPFPWLKKKNQNQGSYPVPGLLEFQYLLLTTLI